MKTLIVIAIVCCIYGTVAGDERKCESNDECESHECCVQTHPFRKATCENLRVEGEFCFPIPEHHLTDNKYRFMCPCEENLECKPEKIEESEDGIVTYTNSRCADPSITTNPEPEPETES